MEAQRDAIRYCTVIHGTDWDEQIHVTDSV